MIKAKKELGEITFWKGGKQVFPVSIRGNIAKFENGELILF